MFFVMPINKRDCLCQTLLSVVLYFYFPDKQKKNILTQCFFFIQSRYHTLLDFHSTGPDTHRVLSHVLKSKALTRC